MSVISATTRRFVSVSIVTVVSAASPSYSAINSESEVKPATSHPIKALRTSALGADQGRRPGRAGLSPQAICDGVLLFLFSRPSSRRGGDPAEALAARHLASHS
jgi:hypothetical protein